jgi:hypothetical protein
MTLETGALIPEWPHESARNSFRNEFPCRWVSKQSLVSRFETLVAAHDSVRVGKRLRFVCVQLACSLSERLAGTSGRGGFLGTVLLLQASGPQSSLLAFQDSKRPFDSALRNASCSHSSAVSNRSATVISRLATSRSASSGRNFRAPFKTLCICGCEMPSIRASPRSVKWPF